MDIMGVGSGKSAVGGDLLNVVIEATTWIPTVGQDLEGVFYIKQKAVHYSSSMVITIVSSSSWTPEIGCIVHELARIQELRPEVRTADGSVSYPAKIATSGWYPHREETLLGKQQLLTELDDEGWTPKADVKVHHMGSIRELRPFPSSSSAPEYSVIIDPMGWVPRAGAKMTKDKKNMFSAKAFPIPAPFVSTVIRPSDWEPKVGMFVGQRGSIVSVDQGKKKKESRGITTVVETTSQWLPLDQIQVQPLIGPSEWTIGLFDCRRDRRNCYYGLLCCPCSACDSIGWLRQRKGRNACCGIMGCLPLVSCCTLYAARRKMRAQYGFSSGHDCCAAFLCGLCATCQLSLELKSRRQLLLVEEEEPTGRKGRKGKKGKKGKK
jgi:Cys-rich protein (TIGR01571 family)